MKNKSGNYNLIESNKYQSPIRVLQVIGIMNRGGAETMIMNMYRKTDRTKVQFDFVENSFERAVFDDEIETLGGRIYRCPHFNGKNYFQYKKWWNSFFKDHSSDYKIIHGHIGSTASIYLRIAKKYGLFTIAHSHNSSTGHSLKQFSYKFLSYNTRNIADYFFACSEVAGIDRFGFKVVNGNCYKVLNNAIDTKLFSFNPDVRNEVREEFKFKNKMVVGHIGRFEKQKNHSFIIEIFRELNRENKESKLLLVGDGTLREEIEELVKQYGIENDVIFAGVRDDVNRLVQAMDVFLFPSLFEGLPVSIIEAQTSGLPCLISDKVPIECKKTDLVDVCSLTDDASIWVNKIFDLASITRSDKSKQILDAGYDIYENAEELEKFYLSLV